MMVVISNPACIRYLRTADSVTNTELVERAMCRRLGITPRRFNRVTMGRHKAADCVNRLPVKITDDRLIQFISLQKTTCGACYRHTVENAMLEVLNRKRG